MIILACLGFWLLGIGTGLFAAWLWFELKDDLDDAREERSARGGAAVVGLRSSDRFTPPTLHLDGPARDDP